MLKSLLLLAILPIFFISAFADPHTIETADNDLTQPGCLETEIGCYTPNTLTVSVGDTITMTNTDESGVHTFTSGTVDGFIGTPDGTFASGLLFFGESFEWTPNTAGEFPYFCTLHAWMQGTIIVEPSDEPIVEPEPDEMEFDMILDELALQGLNNNLMRIADDIARADADIEEMMYYLEGAIERNEWGKIQKYSERIGGLMAFIEICDTLVDKIYEEIQLHS